MKIIINGKAFAKKYRTGVQRYCIELLNSLDKHLAEEVEMLVPEYCEEEFHYKNIKVIKYGKLNLNLWEQIELPFYAKREKKFLLNLCNTSPILNPGIVCIHDLNCIKNQEYYPKLFSIWYKIMIDNAIKRGKKIITVSEFSKSEIENFYNISGVEVIYNSYEHIYSIDSDETFFQRNPKIEKNNYFFTLGTVQKNKNIGWVLNVARRFPDENFVITGYKNQEDIDFNLNNVFYTGYLKDEEIKALMENCKAYIMPSFYEGFGIPPLEAFALGKDIIASDIPVMHEIFENEIAYINPYDYNIEKLEIKNSKNREEILKKFSWDKSGIKLKKVIDETEKM